MKVLLAEADPGSRVLAGALRQGGYQVVTAADGEAAWRALQGPGAPRLAVLDGDLARMGGAAVCRAIRGRSCQAYTYLVLLTGRDGGESLLTGLEAGADVCLRKPVTAPELAAYLRAGRRVVAAQDRLLSACEELRERADRDPLTALWNRGAILDRLEQETERSAREGTPLGVLLADLDHFKGINDGYGHQAGDAVLYQAKRGGRNRVRSQPGGDHLVAAS